MRNMICRVKCIQTALFIKLNKNIMAMKEEIHFRLVWYVWSFASFRSHCVRSSVLINNCIYKPINYNLC